MNKGWVAIDRGITDHWVWNCEFSYGQAWIDLIVNANHKDTTILIKGQLIALKRGQQARSEVTLSKAWGWSRNKIRRYLKHLEKDGMIEQQTGHLTSIITICNYSDFQDLQQLGGTTERHLPEQQKDSRRNTVNNVNNDNNVNNKDIRRFAPPDAQQVINYFHEKFTWSVGTCTAEGNKFVDFYESKGWMVGKAKMKDWQAAARNWGRNAK